MDDFAITVTVTQDVEDYKQETHAKVALRKLRAAGIAIHPGQGLSYVVLRGSKSAADQRAVPVQLLHAGGPLGSEPVRPSRDHYARLLARSMETLLAPLGYTEEDMEQALVGRFTKQGILSISPCRGEVNLRFI